MSYNSEGRGAETRLPTITTEPQPVSHLNHDGVTSQATECLSPCAGLVNPIALIITALQLSLARLGAGHQGGNEAGRENDIAGPWVKEHLKESEHELFSSVLQLASKASYEDCFGTWNDIQTTFTNFGQTLSTTGYFQQILSILEDNKALVQQPLLEWYVVCAGRESGSLVDAWRTALTGFACGLPCNEGRYTLLDLCNDLTALLGRQKAVLPILGVLGFLIDAKLFQRLEGGDFKWRTLFDLVKQANSAPEDQPRVEAVIKVYIGLAEIAWVATDALAELAGALLHPIPNIRQLAANALYALTDDEELKAANWTSPPGELNPLSEAFRARLCARPAISIHHSTPGFTIPKPQFIERNILEVIKGEPSTRARVVRISQTIVVKYGYGTSMAEADTMKFVAGNSSVLIPKLFAAYTYGPFLRSYGGKYDTYIVMEYVHGQRLDKVWDTSDDNTKDHICSLLRSQIKELRNIPISPSSPIGSVGGGPLSVQWLAESRGPFELVESFHNAILKRYGDINKSKTVNILSAMLSNSSHGLVITHGDFRRENVLYVDPNTLVLVDWENGGIYPGYWEFVEAHFSLDRNSDWGQYLPKILDHAYLELGTFWQMWAFLR